MEPSRRPVPAQGLKGTMCLFSRRPALGQPLTRLCPPAWPPRVTQGHQGLCQPSWESPALQDQRAQRPAQPWHTATCPSAPSRPRPVAPAQPGGRQPASPLQGAHLARRGRASSCWLWPCPSALPAPPSSGCTHASCPAGGPPAEEQPGPWPAQACRSLPRGHGLQDLLLPRTKPLALWAELLAPDSHRPESVCTCVGSVCTCLHAGAVVVCGACMLCVCMYVLCVWCLSAVCMYVVWCLHAVYVHVLWGVWCLHAVRVHVCAVCMYVHVCLHAVCMCVGVVPACCVCVCTYVLRV